MSFSVVILAAGQGTRMKSKLPKVLHEAAGRPLVEHVVRAVTPLKPVKTVIVIGHGAEHVRARMQQHPAEFVLQEKQLGTGHALMQTEEALKDLQGNVMVLNGMVAREPIKSSGHDVYYLQRVKPHRARAHHP
jgi:bifunctional N-acetylglucosamine-1-phosphate-uridyltransferase/glucosamine-1-phosphate-acetyltransferase GlmU-like protein